MSEEVNQKTHFPCDCCGLCCQNLSFSSLYNDLNDGHGVCRYFNVSTNRCNIYESRPEKCNIDAMYEKYYATVMSREEFYQINMQACQALKSKIILIKGRKRGG